MNTELWCLCGAQVGYPHDPRCPRPVYRATAREEAAWDAEYAARAARTCSAPFDCTAPVGHAGPCAPKN